MSVQEELSAETSGNVAGDNFKYALKFSFFPLTGPRGGPILGDAGPRGGGPVTQGGSP